MDDAHGETSRLVVHVGEGEMRGVDEVVVESVLVAKGDREGLSLAHGDAEDAPLDEVLTLGQYVGDVLDVDETSAVNDVDTLDVREALAQPEVVGVLLAHEDGTIVALVHPDMVMDADVLGHALTE